MRRILLNALPWALTGLAVWGTVWASPTEKVAFWVRYQDAETGLMWLQPVHSVTFVVRLDPEQGKQRSWPSSGEVLRCRLSPQTVQFKKDGASRDAFLTYMDCGKHSYLLETLELQPLDPSQITDANRLPR